MKFIDILTMDIQNVFMNQHEFTEEHCINGKDMNCLIDNNELGKRNKLYAQHMDGVFSGRKLIYVRGEEFGELPSINQVIILDNDVFTVAETNDECGIYTLILEANMSG